MADEEGRITYKSAGVDIDRADDLKNSLREILRDDNPRVLNSIGAFASLVEIKFDHIREPVLVLKMEEPGSKQILAARYGRLADVGVDLVNHLINDTIMEGGMPVAILDTIICGEICKSDILALIKSMSDACKREGVSLVGGETSEQPNVISKGEYILSAACVGIVDRANIIDGSKIKEGNLVIGVASNGVHTNGYSLIRKLLEIKPSLRKRRIGETDFISAILKPHRCYNTPLQRLFKEQIPINGLAHITGGGIRDNVKRIMPEGLTAVIHKQNIKVPDIFKVIIAEANLDEEEAYRVFNMGIGLVVIAPQESRDCIISVFLERGYDAYVIGEVTAGRGGCLLS